MNLQEVPTVSFNATGLLDHPIATLRKVFASIIADETVTETGRVRLDRFYDQSSVPRDELAVLRDEAFRQAAHSEIFGRGTAQQNTHWLMKLAVELEISPSVMDWMEEEISTLTILNHIEFCKFSEIPKIIPESIILTRGEYAFAEFPAYRVEKETQQYFPADGLPSSGVKLTRGVQYRVGQGKSAFLDRPIPGESSEGFLVITDQRLVFSGTESFSADISGLIGTRVFEDSIQFSMISDSGLKTIGFQNPLWVEYVAVLLSRVLDK